MAKIATREKNEEAVTVKPGQTWKGPSGRSYKLVKTLRKGNVRMEEVDGPASIRVSADALNRVDPFSSRDGWQLQS
jgi:hypothetical protein